MVWNREELLARMRGKEERVRKLLQLFVDEASEREAALKALREGGDVDAAILLTHSLKGNAATLSCAGLAALAKEAEFAYRNGDIKQAQALLPDIEAEFHKVVSRFKEYLSS